MLHEYSVHPLNAYLHRGRVWQVNWLLLLLLLLLGSLLNLSLCLLGCSPELLHLLLMLPGCSTELMLKCVQLCVLGCSLQQCAESASTLKCRRLEGTSSLQAAYATPLMQTTREPQCCGQLEVTHGCKQPVRFHKCRKVIAYQCRQCCKGASRLQHGML